MQNGLTKNDPRDIAIAGLLLTETGISADGKPPTIEQFQGALAYLGRVNTARKWWAGDISNLADGWGDEYVQLLDSLEIDEPKLRNYAWVAKQVSPVRRLLKKAQPREGETEPRMSVSELRDEVREHKLAITREQHPLPTDKYRVLYADPPWQYNDARTGTVESGAAVAQYPLLPTPDICELQDAKGRFAEDRPDVAEAK